MASLAAVVPAVCVLARALQLRTSVRAPPAILMKVASGALLALAAVVIGAIILAGMPE